MKDKRNKNFLNFISSFCSRFVINLAGNVTIINVGGKDEAKDN